MICVNKKYLICNMCKKNSWYVICVKKYLIYNMLHIRRMDWRGELGWMSQLPRELYSQPAVYCKSHLGISLNDRLSETDLSTRWPWLMLMKTTMTLFAPSSSLSSRFDHILLHPFHKHIKGRPGLPSPVCDVTFLSDALSNPNFQLESLFIARHSDLQRNYMNSVS